MSAPAASAASKICSTDVLPSDSTTLEYIVSPSLPFANVISCVWATLFFLKVNVSDPKEDVVEPVGPAVMVIWFSSITALSSWVAAEEAVPETDTPLVTPVRLLDDTPV